MYTTRRMAADLAYSYLHSEGIDPSYSHLFETCGRWLEKYEDLDFISLASLAIVNPAEIHLTDKEIRFFRDFFFPPTF